jgi:hypothetical protein
MGISHGNRGNTILHIVRGEEGRGSEGLSLKIRPYVEDFFLAYLLDKGLKLRAARLMKQYLLLFVLHCHSNHILNNHPSLPFPLHGRVKTGQAEQLDVLCCVPEALRGCNPLKN